MDLLEPTIVNRAYSCSCFSVHALHNSSSTITFGFHCFTFFSFYVLNSNPDNLSINSKELTHFVISEDEFDFYDNSIIFNRLNRLKQVWRPYVYFGFASLRLKRSIKSKERIHFAILFILRLYHISRVLYKFTQGFSAKEIRNKSNTFICLAISIYKLALMIIKSIKPKLHLDSK